MVQYVDLMFRWQFYVYTKAELLQEGIFFQTPIPSLRMFVNKKVGNLIIEARYIISTFKTDII